MGAAESRVSGFFPSAARLGLYEIYILILFHFAYKILVLVPLKYGASFVYLKAARGEPLEIKDMSRGLGNYLNVILASLLVKLIVLMGLVILIVPGIIFACKLAFVPYLIVDRKMEVIEAVKESWRMTTDHTLTVFLIGVLAFFIGIVGFLCYFDKPEVETETQETESRPGKKLPIPPGVAFVTDVYVSPEARRSKAATSLFEILEKSAINAGCNAIWTNTNVRNHRIHTVLKHLGFSVMKDFIIPGKEKDVYFKKELPKST